MDNYYPDFRNHTNDLGDDVGKDCARLIPQNRMYCESDLTELVNISQTCYSGDNRSHAWKRSDFIRAVKNDGLFILIRLDEVGRKVGYMAYRWNPDYYQIFDLAVLPGLQRRKHGTDLVSHLVERLRPHSQRSIVADISCKLPDAMAFFYRRGFRHWHTRMAGSLPVSARYVLLLDDATGGSKSAVCDVPFFGSPIALP